MKRFLRPWVMILAACLLVIFGLLNYVIQPKGQFSLGALMSQFFLAGLLVYFAKKFRSQ